jgi:hypothetical protein
MLLWTCSITTNPETALTTYDEFSFFILSIVAFFGVCSFVALIIEMYKAHFGD